MSNRTDKQKVSLLKRNENMTILLIFIVFLVAITVLQLAISAAKGDISFPNFISPSNLFNVMMQVACVGIMTLGMMLVMVTGAIDLSVGMLVSLVSIFMALCLSKWGIPTPAALVLTLLLAVGCSTGLGFIISKLNVESFIITLGGQLIFQGIALLISNSREVRLLNEELSFFKTNLFPDTWKIGGLSVSLPIYVLIFIIITVIIWLVMKYTKFGRRLYAVGANPSAAFLAGINVSSVRIRAFMINGFLVGLAGIMLLARVNVGIITLGQGLELDAIAGAVIGGVAMSGGKGNAWGVFIGAILLAAIGNAMNILRIQAEWQYVVKGIIIIVAVSAGAISAIMAERNLKKAQLNANKTTPASAAGQPEN